MTENGRLITLLVCLVLVAALLTFGVVAKRPTCTKTIRDGDVVATQLDAPCR